MAFFKRVEVWVLLVISGGLVWFVLSSGKPGDRGERSQPTPVVAVSTPGVGKLAPHLRVDEIRLTRQGDHLVVSLQVSGRVRAQQATALTEATARLVTGGGAVVPWFFLAFDGPPVLPGQEGRLEPVHLRFWLPGSQSRETLWLEIDGERLAVKESGSFPWQRLGENEEAIFSSSGWIL